jgi:ribosome recycling factor
MNIVDQVKSKMTAALEHLKNELKSLRTGRANPSMLDGIVVEVYGAPLRLKEIASITAPEPRQLLITPFEAHNAPAIGKAIEKANIGLMPIVDGNVVRLKIPPMDESMRKEMVKLCHKKKEEAKVSIRIIRREGNEAAKKQKELPQDQVTQLEKKIQILTDDCCKEADNLAEKKEKEISTI